MRHSLLPALAALIAAATYGCGSSSDGDDDDNLQPFDVVTVPFGVAAAAPIVADGPWMAFLASEASTGATDFNGDGDAIDAVAVRVNTTGKAWTNLDVAAQAIAFANRTLFLVVSEAADGKNWNLDPDTDDLVLLYHAPGDPEPTFLAELSQTATTPMVEVDDSVFFVSATTVPMLTGETNLLRADVDTSGGVPTMPVMVTTSIVDPNGDGVSVDLLGAADGLVFLAIDETVDGELNADGDALDLSVLALLDGVGDVTMIHGTGTAVDPTAPFDALETQDGWTVAWLVNELDQGVNLNEFIAGVTFPLDWQPTNCAGFEDADMDDDVLHWGVFSDFAGITPVNTGLVGSVGPEQYVYIHPDEFVGVVSLESDEGSGGGCNLNGVPGGDTDTNDRIFRWVDASDDTAPVLPVTDPNQLVALVATVPGLYGDSTGGVVAFDGFWAALVDEAADGRDHDNDAGTDNLVIGANNPNNAGNGWNFLHGTQDNPVSATWLAADAQNGSRFLVAFDEGLGGLDLNLDGDDNDSVPTFPHSLNGTVLEFPGFGVAVPQSNAGIVTAKGVGYYRVSETAEDNTDVNEDGDDDDYVLQRIGLSTNDLPTYMGTLNNEDMPAVIFETGATPQFGAFLYDEKMVSSGNKQDLNDDGDGDDFVLRYFRLP